MVGTGRMSFTDLDIKRLKEFIAITRKRYKSQLDINDHKLYDEIEALLARLECAEVAIRYLRIVQEDDGESIEYSSGIRDEADESYEAWRKSRGL